MKSFLTTMKGKVIAGLVTVGAIGAIVVAVVMMNSGYRTIAIEELNGVTRIINNEKTTEAYIGQHLKSGDDVTVTASSDMTMALDSDKYVYAKENTHFWLEASGKKRDTRTNIHLDDGSVLCRIDNKLGNTESFDVETPNATMSVRGTVYRVACYRETNGDKYTVIDVLEGEVYVQVKMENGQNTEESRLLKIGEHAVVRSNSDFSEFIKSEEDFDYNPENDNGTALKRIDNIITTIDYTSFNKQEAYFLGKTIDAGRTLSITKDLLYDVTNIIDHDFSIKGGEVPSTCKEEGYYYDVCSICGIQGEKHIIERERHTYIVKNVDEDIYECEVCGKEADAKTVALENEEVSVTGEDKVSENNKEEDNNSEDSKTESGKTEDKKLEEDKPADCSGKHKYVVTRTTEASCTKEGEKIEKCSNCGDILTTKIAASGHDYKESSKAATCTEAGYEEKRCSRCGDTITSTTAALGHSYSTSHKNATCTEAGYEENRCSRCGDTTTSTIAALGHSYSTSHKDATCTDAGYDQKRCDRCGDTSSSSIPASGHSYSLSSTTQATCTSQGTETYSCSKCGDSYTNSTGLAPHNFILKRDDVTMPDGTVYPGNSYMACSVCGARN